MWVILCPRRKHHTNQIAERLAPPARARKRSDVTRGHMWAMETLVSQQPIQTRDHDDNVIYLTHVIVAKPTVVVAMSDSDPDV